MDFDKLAEKQAALNIQKNNNNNNWKLRWILNVTLGNAIQSTAFITMIFASIHSMACCKYFYIGFFNKLCDSLYKYLGRRDSSKLWWYHRPEIASFVLMFVLHGNN